MNFSIGDRVRVVELEEAERGSGINIGDTGVIIAIHNPGEISLDVQLDKTIIEDHSNANFIGNNAYQFWEYQLKIID